MKFKKHLIGVLASIMILSQLSAAEHPFKLNDSDYEKMLKSTLVSTGNNYRLKKVIGKIRNGENVYIAALGGSVTEGAGPRNFTDGYAYQFFRALKAKYAPGDGKNVYFNNAGLSGTGSLVGIVRYQQDVVEILGKNPDLLIVEFAVNDNGEEFVARAFESIVRNALIANPECAVIAMYSAATYGNSMGQKKPVADYYAIPQINMLDVVNDSIKSGIFRKEQYYSDYVHPTFEGHNLMCDSLINLLDVSDKAELDTVFKIPEKVFKEVSMAEMKRIFGDDENVKIDVGGFNSVDKKCQTIKKTNASDFPKNWNKKLNAKPNLAPFRMEITCSNLIFIYKNQANGDFEKFGKAVVFVDGKRIDTYDGGKEGGWNNCEPRLIINEKTAGKHTVEVTMAPGYEKLGFTIVAMGYTK